MTQHADARRSCLGAFAGAHGVKGDVKIKAFTETGEAVATYGPVESEDGAQTFTLTVIKTLNDGFVLARAPEIQTREAAQALKGERFYVDRAALPPPDEDEYYLDDLVGLGAQDENGKPFGVVRAVYNFGADDLLEIGDIPDIKGVRLIPFTKANVPAVDLGAGEITVVRAAIKLGDNDDTGDGGDANRESERRQ